MRKTMDFFSTLLLVVANLCNLRILENTFCIYGFDHFFVPIDLKFVQKYQHLGSVCLKEVRVTNSNCKLQIYATYYFFSNYILCSGF